MGQDRSVYADAQALQARSGIAPIRRQSGKKSVTVRRVVCPHFERQTFVEWAGEPRREASRDRQRRRSCPQGEATVRRWLSQTIPRSAWAKAYYQSQIEAGKMHHTAVRALAYKWQRILYRCWQERTEYDEAKYLTALRKQGSPLIARMEAMQAQAQTPKPKPTKSAAKAHAPSANANRKPM